MKRCTRCQMTKDTSAFYRDARRSDGLKSHCKSCHNLSARRWQLANRERDLQNKRDYIASRREDPEYVSRERRAFSVWRDANLEHHRALGRDWHRQNRDQSKLNSHARRARIAAAQQGDPEAFRDYVAILRNDPCAYCGAPAEVVDHIDAISSGGTNAWDNLTAACRACNSSKHARPLLLWMAGPWLTT